MARFFQNTSTQLIRIPCELHIPAGATSLPVEHGGIRFTSEGELVIRGHAERGELVVSRADDLDDRCGPPPIPPGTLRPTMIGARDGDVAVGHVVRTTAAATEVSKGGQLVRQYACLNETTTASINIWVPDVPLDLGARLQVVAISTGAFVEGGVTHRAVACSWLNPPASLGGYTPGHTYAHAG